jgi:hypothetical protein
MSDVKRPPPMGQDLAASSLIWSEAADARAWIDGLRGHIADARGAAKDQMRPRRKRRLGHLEAKRILKETFRSIDKAISFAESGLPPGPDFL